jgi:nucleolar protein 9
MPREKIQRGRRKEQKQEKTEAKRKREETLGESTKKRPRSSAVEDYIPLEDDRAQDLRQDSTSDQPFYGLLDTEEQEYFSRANEMLELNQFGDPEERKLFIESVYEEAKGKELKIACSQSCSRLLEKLISISEIHQIRKLFNEFLGHFLHLVQHRFASHCCETLFIHAALAVPAKNTKKEKTEHTVSDGSEENPQLSLQDMFLQVLQELEGNWGYLLTERFASHTIRVLLLILAGEPVDITSNTSVVASRKKERLGAISGETQKDAQQLQKRTVPESFGVALQKAMNQITSGLDDTYLRALATHPIGNPVLQVLLSLELSNLGTPGSKKTNSITQRLIPNESMEEGTETATFLKGLLYDPVGSRLLETFVRHAPGKSFKNFRKNIMYDRIGSLARNETASYIVVRVLERIGKDDLQHDLNLILPEIPGLLSRSRLNVPKALIERCMVRDVDLTPLTKAIQSSYDENPVLRLKQMLKLDNDLRNPEGETDHNSSKPKAEGGRTIAHPEQTHGSLFAQVMLRAPGDMSDLVYSSLLALETEELLQFAKSAVMSHIIQEALTQSTSTSQFRRQFVPRFLGHLRDLAVDSSGSHVVDSLWLATNDIFFIKERIAQELAQDEPALRDSFLGRAVWRNWYMDLYKRRRGEWARKAKGLETNNVVDANESKLGLKQTEVKSKIDLARARFAQKEEIAATAKQKQNRQTQTPVAT